MFQSNTAALALGKSNPKNVFNAILTAKDSGRGDLAGEESEKFHAFTLNNELINKT